MNFTLLLSNALLAIVLAASLLCSLPAKSFADSPLRISQTATSNQPRTQTATSQTQAAWDPRRTWVFLVGILKWPKKAGLDAFEANNRKDLALRDAFLKLGVPGDHIVYLADESATLRAIDDQLSKLLARTQTGDFLVTYYCGHGWTSEGQAYFGNYDADDNDDNCWRVSSLAQKLAREFNGSTALLTADCCHSGALGEEIIRVKPPFDYGTSSSSTSAVSSTGNWTFTQGLLDCLLGHRYADYDNNGLITFAELTKYLQAEMQSLEKQNTAACGSPNFDPSFAIAKVLFPNEPIPELAEVLWEGEWHPVKVVQKAEGKRRVRWIEIGWDAPESDEWVSMKDIRPLRKEALNLPKPTAQMWAVGTQVKVESEGQYYPAEILKYRNGSYFVHYDGYESTDDEWVEAERIRP